MAQRGIKRVRKEYEHIKLSYDAICEAVHERFLHKPLVLKKKTCLPLEISLSTYHTEISHIILTVIMLGFDF